MRINTETDSLVSNKTYIINNNVIFIVKDYSLVYGTPSVKKTLHRPAGLCLQFLLENSERLVSQEELISEGWGQTRAKYITPNAFYQCMHNLRKSLQEAGCGELVYTIPRKGVGINADVSIVIEQSQPPPADIHRKKSHILFRPSSFLLITLILVFLLFKYGGGYYKNAFNKYSKIKINHCEIYSSINNIDLKRASLLLNRANVRCENSERIFITASKLNIRSSLIICPRYKFNSQDCYSTIVMDGPLP